jgi:hypothetical protein
VVVVPLVVVVLSDVIVVTVRVVVVVVRVVVVVGRIVVVLLSSDEMLRLPVMGISTPSTLKAPLKVFVPVSPDGGVTS